MASQSPGKQRLRWCDRGDGDPVKRPLETGSYFGRRCVEAGVKMFDINDTHAWITRTILMILSGMAAAHAIPMHPRHFV